MEQVARGEISAEEAHRRLAQSPAVTPAGPAAEPAPAASPPVESGEPVARVAIRASAVRLVVIGDPAVDTALADGPHRAEKSGDRLTIHSDLSAGQYQNEAPRSAFASWLTSMNKAGSTLTVRVNPDLPLEVLNVAGSLELSGVHAATSVGVEAGSARLYEGAGPLVLSVATGSADVDWTFSGECSVSTDLGSARVHVRPGSDVAITAEATMGMATIRLADGTTLKASPGGNPPVVVGSGAGRLAVTSRLGSLVVSVT